VIKDENYFASIVESSDDAIITKDLNGIILSWNRGAEAIFGYKGHEIIGKPVATLIPHDHEDEEPRILARIRAGEKIDHYETIRKKKDGTLLNISLTVSPIKDASGKIIGASKIARDVTQQRKADEIVRTTREEMARLNADLEQRVKDRTASLNDAVAQMEEFSYTVSHDLRAPLRSIQVYAEALLEEFGPALAPEAQRYLSRITDCALRLDKMVLDVLTFSRAGRSKNHIVPVNVDQLVRQIVEQYPGMNPAHATIEINALPVVMGDEASLTQVMSNLLNNAVKFVAPGVVPKIRISGERHDGWVRLSVRDNGIGVSPEYQSRLFNMFERIHPGSNYEGTGVGLAIVRRAAGRMGGRVGMESDGVNGCVFWVELPCQETKN
jgi:PAS domain S-box-containing protein